VEDEGPPYSTVWQTLSASRTPEKSKEACSGSNNLQTPKTSKMDPQRSKCISRESGATILPLLNPGRLQDETATSATQKGVDEMDIVCPSDQVETQDICNDNGKAQTQEIGDDNGIAETQSIVGDNGKAETQSIVGDNGKAQTQEIGDDNGKAQTQEIGDDNGIAETQSIGGDNGIAETQGIGDDNGKAQTQDIGNDEGIAGAETSKSVVRGSENPKMQPAMSPSDTQASEARTSRQSETPKTLDWIVVAGIEDDGRETLWIGQIVEMKPNGHATVRYVRSVTNNDIEETEAYRDEIAATLRRGEPCFTFYESRRFYKRFREGDVNINAVSHVILQSEEVCVHLEWKEQGNSINKLFTFPIKPERRQFIEAKIWNEYAEEVQQIDGYVISAACQPYECK
jgi:hypothetical protein